MSVGCKGAENRLRDYLVTQDQRVHRVELRGRITAKVASHRRRE